MELSNLVLSKEIAYFDNFPARSGITTVDFGSCHLLGSEEESLNAKLVGLMLGNCFFKIRPQHSDKIQLMRYFSRHNYYDCDALIFSTKKFSNYAFKPVLISNTADCPIIILANSSFGLSSIVHSGWKGTYKNIVGKTVKEIHRKYSLPPVKLFAFVWPGICHDCYEVGQEFNNFFPGLVINQRLDLKTIIIQQLEKAGVENIITSDACSYCSTHQGKNLFYSHRREQNGLRNCVFTIV